MFKLKSNKTGWLPATALILSLLFAPEAKTIRAAPETALQELSISGNFADQELAPNRTIELRLNRPLSPLEGRVAVFIGATDLTSLFAATGNSLSYTPNLIPLPAGETPVTVYLVSPANEWREVARLTLRVNTEPVVAPGADPAQPAQPQQPTADPAPAAADGKWQFTPSLTLGMKSQMAERHFPATNRPERPTFSDFTLQGTAKTEMTRGWLNAQTQFDVVGSSFQKEALRFGERGNDAPQVDLSNYLMQFQLNKAKLQVGHTSFGTNRLLISGYGSRGVTLSLPLTRRSDVSFAAMNGTSIVGWNNFFGLNRRKHQIVGGTLGFEFLSQRPGGLRLEAGALHGSLLPLAGFNQGVINDAERSNGASLRLIATDKTQRFKLEGGFARSRFNNPTDPLLDRNLPVVPVRETARNARYLDASYTALKDWKLSLAKTANLVVNFRHERVDPLYRSVAAFMQADRQQNQVEIAGNAGDFTFTASHQRFNDNLADIPSILKTLTRRDVVIAGLPLASLLNEAAKQSPQAAWLPRLSYNLDRTHQFGKGLPGNSGFDNLSQVPDQISTNHLFNAEWQWEKWRLGYRFNQSFQDNRQPGRALADLRNLINGFTVGLNPHAAFDLNFDLNVESAKNFEARRTDRTLRAGAGTNWRMTPKTTLNATVSNTLIGDIARTTRNRNTEFDLQWSYSFGFGETGWKKMKGQFFIRYADRYARARDFLFGLDNQTRLQTLNTGLNFVFF
jgi:hypothetical protein